jgi:hypothetical protein
MLREFSFQSSSVTGHVVNDTSSSVTVPLASTPCRVPRRARRYWGSSNCAPSVRASAGEYFSLLPRTLSAGLELDGAWAWPGRSSRCTRAISVDDLVAIAR